ncbi:MAG: hypothetical protein KKE44_15455 [Proteobacteria bacterium]|nr:hypothetical protein [Pseudomonadota bacterium]MBU1584126.1 hypothetical protein [Pseudomonadota bacterium]MBU2453926.1 hypothetical protein [Pseudomonadota bacterium]MBU2627663.1 hypothetical protein [Pseudomonadota bacterium]
MKHNNFIIKTVLTNIAVLFFLPVTVFATDPATRQNPIKINPLPTIQTKTKNFFKTTWTAMQFKALVIEKKKNTWTWSAIVKNNGPLLQKGRIQVTASQLLVTKPIGLAGMPFTYGKEIKNGQTMNIGRHSWKLIPRATHLKVEIKDLQSGKMIYKTVRITD